MWQRYRNKDGYGKVRYHTKWISVHQAVWLEFVGPIPKGMKIDHRCHNPGCARLEHLRLVTHKQNMENYKGARVDNSTGYQGVTYRKRTGTYCARVQNNGRREYLGDFATAEEAGEVARLRRLELFTHNETDKHIDSRTV